MTTVHQVFTPNETPSFTYVDRSHLKLEQKLRDALAMGNMVVSISGPSKSGKTVLVKKIISEDQIIPLSGAAIKEANQLWEHALNWMGTPTNTTTATTTGGSAQVAGKASATAGLLIAKGSAEIGGSGTLSHQVTKTETGRTAAFQQIAKEIGGSDFVLFVDDFHYIDRAVQIELGKQIKALAESKVKICVASVPHRADDVLRSNPELSGRVATVNSDYWSIDDLSLIANRGMKALNFDWPNSVTDHLAKESFGIPQLMQLLCLNLCLEVDIRSDQSDSKRHEISSDTIMKTLERTSDFTDYSSVVQGLHSGPKERGTERKQFELADGSTGDVYRCALFALRQDPPQLTFTYDEMMARIRAICKGESPVGSSVTNALAQMQTLTETLSPNVPILDWNENTLSVVEPYFLFFLRASRKLERVAIDSAAKKK